MRGVMALLAAARALQPAARGARRPRTRLHATKVEGPSMDQVVQLCRQRGFVFGSSEIYNGFNGFYDYGPLGCELKKNIKDLWWRDFVHGREDVHGLDSSIIASPAVWRASGHVDKALEALLLVSPDVASTALSTRTPTTCRRLSGYVITCSTTLGAGATPFL